MAKSKGRRGGEGRGGEGREGRGGKGWGGVGGGQKEWCKYVYEQLEWQMEHHQHLKNKNTLHMPFVLLPLLVYMRTSKSEEIRRQQAWQVV